MAVNEVSPLSILIGAALAVILTWRCILQPAVLSPLAKIPNAHWSAPLSRVWILGIRFVHRENRTLHDAHRRLGPVIRIGPNELSINDMDCVRTVYQGGFDKPAWYSVFDNYGVPCMFSERAAAEHSARKRLISNVYSKSYIQSSPSAAAQARALLYDRLLPLLGISPANHCIDMYSVFMAATMDFITAYIFGLDNSSNFLSKRAYGDHFLELYKARNDYGFFDNEMPRLARICRKMSIPLCPKWVDAANKELGDWCQGLCQATAKRFTSAKWTSAASVSQPTVWNALVSGLQKEFEAHGTTSVLYPKALLNTPFSVVSELFDHAMAGQETTGITLSYLSWQLSQSLSLQAALRAELAGLAPNMRLDQGGKETLLPDYKQLDSLPLLHAVVMETLRLHAPLPGAQPRQTPQAGCQIGKYKVPGTVRIAAMPYTLHRDENIFPEPERWVYTRWLPSADDSEEERKKLQRRQFWAFSSGGRMCIGSNFAMHEMKLIIAAIYSNYTSHIVDDAGMTCQSDGFGLRLAEAQCV
ncbi:cytochrome P450 [Lasiosphaeria miniovina]|uniref:Cytochrome P450 n=1 Tax=Lasiosphaeria miniovina TaxID=1954250 RepID=A0AA40A559_9PEZI|nr:cytochrome P450 [Lasiosphaeria miniovina]KAK0709509.1 cytochrome P450 [Lasiosphaeria miniovina]